MPIAFDKLQLGEEYGRPELAELWGYATWNAISRGVITPAGDNKIVLFVTKEKQEALHQYEDHFVGDQLHWEGETNHANDTRVVNAKSSGHSIHLFYRERHHSNFTFLGPVQLIRHILNRDAPSQFVFDTVRSEAIAANALVTEEITHGYGDDFVGDAEGKRRHKLHLSYERSPRNRAEAIRIHGTTCHCCGFDFNRVYGRAYAREFIEIHHIKSISEGEAIINPATDLVPLCSNCHSMAHRRRNVILPVTELQELIRDEEANRQVGAKAEQPR